VTDQEYEPEDSYQKTRQFWRDHFKGRCVEELQRDGWRVYTRGFPTVIAEKGNFLRMIVVSPRVTLGRGGWMGKNRDALSRVFFKCFGVKYEVWNDPDSEVNEKEWV